MREPSRKWALLGIEAFLTLAFAATGPAKLAGVQMMLDEFWMLGLGQWFR